MGSPRRPPKRVLFIEGQDAHGRICYIDVDMDTGEAIGNYPFGGRAVLAKTHYTQDEIAAIVNGHDDLELLGETDGLATDEW